MVGCRKKSCDGANCRGEGCFIIESRVDEEEEEEEEEEDGEEEEEGGRRS